MAKALITGAAGFIGGALTRRLLAQGWEVHALLGQSCLRENLADLESRLKVHLHDGSIESMLNIMGESSPDVVFHLASLFLSDHQPQDVERLISSNILFSAQLVEAMSRSGVTRLVNTGTSWQHFETGAYRPVNLYAATKQAFEDIVAYYYDARGLSCLTLKLFDTYGPGDRRRKLVTILVEAVQTGDSLDMSPGEQVIELTHATDVASAFERAGLLLLQSKQPFRADNLIPGTRLTVRELVALISRVAERPLNVQWGGRPYREREVMKPIAVEGRALGGWTPSISLEEGIGQLIKEVRR